MKKKTSTPMYDEELLEALLAIFEQVFESLRKKQTQDPSTMTAPM